MARNRQRARDRKARQGTHHEDVPGELEHASGEVEEFDASLIQGADGEPADIDDAELETAAVEAGPPAPPPGTGAAFDDDDDDEDGQPQRRPSGPRPGGNRVLNFLRASWSELQRVQWPDRRQVAQATAVVLGFVAIAGVYLGVADWAAQKIVNYIL